MTGCDWTHFCERRAAGAAMSPADGSYDASVPVCVVHALEARLYRWSIRRLRGGPIKGSWLPEDLVCVCIDPADDLAGCCGGCGRELITSELIAALVDLGHKDEARSFARIHARQGIEAVAS